MTPSGSLQIVIIQPANVSSAVLKRVFRHLRYSMVVLGVAFVALSAALLLPNWNIAWQFVSSNGVGLFDKLFFLGSLYGSLYSNFSLLSGAYLVVIAMMFGINVALLTFYIRRRQEATQNAKFGLVGLGGTVASILGIGCATCGSIILTSVLSMLGIGGLLTLLPLHGLEFGIVGLVLLSFSIKYLINRINDPLVCPAKG